MLGGYIDGSNLHAGAPVVVVGGCAANTDAWLRWEVEWQHLLTFCKVEKWHHTEFVNRIGRYIHMNHAEWLVARRMLCDSFASLKPICFGTTVWREEYDALRGEHPSIPEDPYFFLLDRCLHRLIQGLFENPNDEGILVYCDRDKNKDLVLNLARWHEAFLRSDPHARPGDKIRKVVTSYGSGLEFMPLQAADVVAHELMQYARKNRGIPVVATNLPSGSWILDRLKSAFPWLVMNYRKDFLKMELDGRAFVPGHWPGYHFVPAARL